LFPTTASSSFSVFLRTRGNQRVAFGITFLALSIGIAIGEPDAVAAPEPKEASEEAHRTYLELLRSDERFPSAETCAQCHPDHYREWSASPHAYAMVSPVFNAMQMFIAEETAGTNGDFCIRCHSPVALQREENPHVSVLVRPPVSNEGVTCIVCHRIDTDYGTASGRLTLQEGNIFEPIYGPTGSGKLKEAIESEEFGLVTSAEETGKRVHEDVIRFTEMRASATCGTCHDVNAPNGFRLESAFTQFKNSPASRDGESCQDCHMGKTPGVVYDGKDRFATAGRDLNYDWGPAAKVKSSPRDPREGQPTPPRRRTNHMFIGPDYSVVHPALFPHSLEARELTYGQRFNAATRRELEAYLKGLDKPTPDQRTSAKERAMRVAEKEATENVQTDWLKFRWWEGWGTPDFEADQNEKMRQQLLSGVGFPWEDEEKPEEAQLRRQVARLILNRQFNLLNEAHVERVRLLRRGYQIEKVEIRRNSASGLNFAVKVINPTDGHGTPTGFDAERLVFLEVSVHDAHGKVLLHSGDRDPNGDVRDLHSAYVHHHAKKEGEWLAASNWKNPAGLPQTSGDKF
jgi:nitrate/TMAO reductase-like tetraheme cytochrome c subunit